jgi:hypothetical protein
LRVVVDGIDQLSLPLSNLRDRAQVGSRFWVTARENARRPRRHRAAWRVAILNPLLREAG